ncbi:MAG: SRPBCC domain-containing protein [Bacteroidia bacterium]|nr:SRPBCC domain-containing protein [Bacteroidia bacterium]MCC7532750.1 SRPBCC domain-containing protein [Bacteroidia bacterium]MCZ2141027.1 SRPBCC domain-containing protein [Bacteroidia bacterium]
MAKRKKVRLEYPIKSSPSILYNSISSPSGLSTWFADDVDIYNNNFKFKWDGDEQIAELVKKSPNKYIKFKWKDSANDEYFEFEIIQDELTDDVALVVTDFVDEADEVNAIHLWDSQIQELKNSLGA